MSKLTPERKKTRPFQLKNTEKYLEKRLKEQIELFGGEAVKFFSTAAIGWPDRWILMPGGKIYFVELKTKGKAPTPIQRSRHEWLRKNDFEIKVVDSLEKLEEFIQKLKHDL